MEKEKFVDNKLLEKIKNWEEDDPPVKTYSRSSHITEDFVGKPVEIHNGRDFIRVYITEEMVGHRLGEFALTRRFTKHGGAKETLL